MKPLRYAAALAIGYCLIVASYIWISGKWAAQYAASLEQLEHFERAKGLVFVAVTTAMLFVASLMLFRRLGAAIQEREQERQAIMLAQRRILAGELAAAVAHDFNNLLMVIGASLERQGTTPDDQESLRDARHAVARGSDLALHLARTARGQREHVPQLRDLAATVQRTVTTLQRLPRLRDCLIDVQCEHDLAAMVDETLVEQLLANLLLNAADAVQGQGQIRVVVTGLPNTIQLGIHDNGPGIPEAEHAAMFSAFVTTKASGLGLGLLSVKTTVESHGGSITVGTSPLGGACFTVQIPRQPKTS